MAKELIYIVEDEEDIQELISYNLSKEGFLVKGFINGEDMLSLLQRSQPDCIILDLMLSGIDGLEVCRIVKAKDETANIPIIMLTAKGEESDIVTGLELGADDYIVKPFSPRILIARLKAVLRRKRVTKELNLETLRLFEITIHPGRHEVMVKDKKVELTSSEFRALYLLAGKPGWVFTRWQIIERVHGNDYPVTDRSVDVLIVGLRKKLGSAGKYIDTVRGIGYRFRDIE